MVSTRNQRARSLSKEIDVSETIEVNNSDELKENNEKLEEKEDNESPGENDDSQSEEDEDSTTLNEEKQRISAEDSRGNTDRIRLTKAPTMLKSTNMPSGKNELTKLIPGYTAPMRLNTPSLDRYRPTGGIKDLQRRAERTDASTKGFVIETSRRHTDSMQKTSRGFLPTSYTAAYSSFKKGVKRTKNESAGKGWFNMQPTQMTEELKTDLAVVRNRTYLDPKKFYKSADKSHSIVQLGTVIEGAAEYCSSRLTKKQRRSNITEEILADPSTADYATNKFKQMSRDRNARAMKAKKRRSNKR